MNIVFFGSSQFAVPSLTVLLNRGYKISCVVTQPDRKKGRGLHLTETPVKIKALENGLGIYQPKDINTVESIKFLKDLNPDLFIVIAYGQILSKEVLEIPRIFSINVHASLLPKYRGAAPINWVIIKGEKITGVTIMKMIKEMDAGPIILQKTTGIDKNDTAITLEDRLANIAGELVPRVISFCNRHSVQCRVTSSIKELSHEALVVESLESIQNNTYKLTPQDENSVTFAPKLKKEDGLINWNKPAEEINNLIKGCLNWPGAFTHYKGKLLKIYKAVVSQPPPNGGVPPKAASASQPATAEWRGAAKGGISPSAGEIIDVSKRGIVVATGRGNLIIEELQLEGKRRMKVEEFIAGHKIIPGEIFTF